MTSFNSVFTFPNIDSYDYLADGSIIASGSTVSIFTTGAGTITTTSFAIGESGSSVATTVSTTGLYNTNGAFNNGWLPETDVAAGSFGGYAIAFTWGSSSPVGSVGGVSITFRATDGTPYQIQTPASSTTGVNGTSILALSGNDYGVVWAQDNAADGDGYSIMFQRYDILGRSSGAATVLNTDTTFDQIDPTMVARAGGGFAMAYTTHNGTSGVVRLEFYNDAGVKVAGGGARSAAVHDAGNAELVQLENGNLVLVYEDLTSGGVYYRVMTAAGAPLAYPSAVHPFGEEAMSGHHSVTALSNGGFAVAYLRDDPATSADTVYFQRFDSAGNTVGVLENSGVNSNQSSGYQTSIMEMPNGALAVNGRFFDYGSYLADYIEADSAAKWLLYGGDDVFTGTSGSDTVFGMAGADYINGAAGDDYINGGGGVVDVAQILDGGAGHDTIISAHGGIITGGYGNDRIFGGGTRVSSPGAGGDFDDIINAGAGNDVIYARQGADLIDGGGGNDIIRAGSGDDTVFGGDGNDRIFSSASGDEGVEIDAGTGADTVYSGAGNDTINGGAGNDRIEGNGGDDLITGGANADAFLYRYLGSGDDVIFDFQNGADKLHIGAAYATSFGALDWETNGTDVLLWLGAGQIDSVLLLNMAGLFDASDVVFV